MFTLIMGIVSHFPLWLIERFSLSVLVSWQSLLVMICPSDQFVLSHAFGGFIRWKHVSLFPVDAQLDEIGVAFVKNSINAIEKRGEAAVWSQDTHWAHVPLHTHTHTHLSCLRSTDANRRSSTHTQTLSSDWCSHVTSLSHTHTCGHRRRQTSFLTHTPELSDAAPLLGVGGGAWFNDPGTNRQHLDIIINVCENPN